MNEQTKTQAKTNHKKPPQNQTTQQKQTKKPQQTNNKPEMRGWQEILNICMK